MSSLDKNIGLNRLHFMSIVLCSLMLLSCSGETVEESSDNGTLILSHKLLIHVNGERQNEERIHVPIMRNDDFDNVVSYQTKPVIDWEAQGYVDDDLVPIRFSLPHKDTTILRLEDENLVFIINGVETVCPLGVRFWKDSLKTEKVSLPAEFTISNSPLTLYAEAHPSQAEVFNQISIGALKATVDGNVNSYKSIVFEPFTLYFGKFDKNTAQFFSYPHNWVVLSEEIAVSLAGYTTKNPTQWIVDHDTINTADGVNGLLLTNEGSSNQLITVGVSKLEKKHFVSNDPRLDLTVGVKLGEQWFKKTNRVSLGHWAGVAMSSTTFEERNAEVKRVASEMGLPTVEEANWYAFGDDWRDYLEGYGVTENPTNNRIQYCGVGESGVRGLLTTCNGWPAVVCIFDEIWQDNGTEQKLRGTLQHENRHAEQWDEARRNQPAGNLMYLLKTTLDSVPQMVDFMEVEAHLMQLIDPSYDYYGVTQKIGHYYHYSTYWSNAINTKNAINDSVFKKMLQNFLLDKYEQIPWLDLKANGIGDTNAFIPYPVQ